MTDSQLAELLRAVLARPDDHGVLRVYADLLLERGDPRGELIVVQHERTQLDTAALAQRERELTAALSTQLATQLGQPAVHFTWRLGFLDSVDFTPVIGCAPLAESLRALGTMPLARALRRIVVRLVAPGWGPVRSALAPLARVVPQWRVRELVITEDARPDAPAAAVSAPVGDLSALYRALPHLEELEIPMLNDFAGLSGADELRKLRRLAFHDPQNYGARWLDDVRPRALVELVMRRVGWQSRGWWQNRGWLQTLLARPLPRLQALQLSSPEPRAMRALVRHVPPSPFAAGLRILSFAGGPIDDICVRELVRHATLLRLERLELGAVSPHHRDRLGQTFTNLVVAG